VLKDNKDFKNFKIGVIGLFDTKKVSDGGSLTCGDIDEVYRAI